ncbi:hypothetical protein BH10CYA1_BH10CYA1_38500 [soil metagenome]
MRNSNRNGDLLTLGVAGLLGFIAFKALTSNRPSNQQRALPQPRRQFLVLYSTHGAEFHFADGSNDVPAGPYMTFDEAAAVAERFDTASDIVEGRACVFDVREGVKYNPYPTAAAQ